MNPRHAPGRRFFQTHPAATPAIILALAFSLLSGCSWGRRVEKSTQPHLAQKINAVLHSLDDSGAIVSARFLEVPSGRVIYQTPNTDYPFKPASNMKLLVTATALDHFHAGHTFKTYLALNGNDLWIIGTGDPATGDPAIAKDHGQTTTTLLDQWAQALKDRGVTEIAGDLVYDDRALDDFHLHPSWWPDDL